MPFTWDSDLKEKTGQKAKEKKGDVVVDDKALEHSLRISIVGVGDDLEDVVKEIIEDTTADVAKISLVFEGKKEALIKTRTEIAQIISTHGGQEKLDLHLEEQASH